MNQERRAEQHRLVKALAKLLWERDRIGSHGPIGQWLDRRIELGSKALYDFHRAVIRHDGCAEAKPKRKVRATKQAKPSTEPIHVLPSDQ